MTNLLMAALVLASAPTDSWELKIPFKEKLQQEHDVLIYISMGGEERDVELISQLKIDKKTDTGYEGTYGFKDIYVGGQPQDGGTWPAKFNSGGMIMSMEADEGPGMRRMFLPFFMVYPDKAVAVGDTWKHADKDDEAVDGHTVTVEYKALEVTKAGKADALKVEFKLKEKGPAPMVGDGYFLLGRDGRVLKYKINIEGWPVPIAGTTFNAVITGEIVD